MKGRYECRYGTFIMQNEIIFMETFEEWSTKEVKVEDIVTLENVESWNVQVTRHRVKSRDFCRGMYTHFF